MYRLSDSTENYLVAIYDLEESQRVARVKDIAEYLGVKMPSVTGAIRALKGKGLVDHEKNSFVTLTEHGRRVAGTTKRKRELLRHFFGDVLLLDTPKAEALACLVEHDIDAETTMRLRNTLKYLEQAIERERLSPDGWRRRLAEE